MTQPRSTKLSSLFPGRTARTPAPSQRRPADARRRLRRLELAEQLERRNLMAVDSIDFRSPSDFFIDASAGPLVNSEYASYRINYSGVNYSDIWVKLTNDIGDVVHRGTYEDGLYHVGPLNGTGFAMAYLYFTADGTTAAPQTHTITVYDGNPDDPSVTATQIFAPQNFTFNRVIDVLSANDSKIFSATVSPAAPAVVPIGSTITLTVIGQLGQADNVLFSPASRSDWKADAYVLESTSITIDGVLQPADQIFYTGLPGGNTQQQTTAIYTFRIADVTGPTVSEPTQFTQKGGSKYKNDETDVLVTLPGSYNATSVVKLANGELHPESDPLVVSDTGELVVFTLRFTNTSDRTIVMDSIQDTLPAGMGTANFVGPATYTKQGGSTAILPAPVAKVSAGLTTLTWTNPFPLPGYPNFEIDAGKYADVTFQVVMPTGTGNYENSSVGRIGKVVIDTTPNTTTDVVPATAWVSCRTTADLSITKTNTPSATVIAGAILSYQLIVSNAGPSNVTGATVLDPLPFDFMNATWTAAFFGGAMGTATGTGDINTLINLPKNSSAIYTIYGLVDPATAATSISNTASVVAPTSVFDPATGNNSSTVSNGITRQGDLSIEKTASDLSVVAGDDLSYTLTVNNTGTSTATGATIADTFPGDFTNATWTAVYFGGASGATSGSGAINTPVTIPTGGQVVFSVYGVIAPDSSANAITNTASVTPSSNFTDTNTTNNSSTVTTSVTLRADLSITKTPDTGTYVGGEEITYTIEVTNLGPATIPGTMVTDPLPIGTTFVSATGGSLVGSTVTFVVGPLAAGASQSFTLTIQADIDRTGDVINVATVEVPPGFFDPNLANNTATAVRFERQPPLSVEGGLVIGTDDGCKNRTDTVVRVIDALDGGAELLAFVPYVGWRGSVRVATGDVNGDGIDEIVTAPGRNRIGEIRVFDSTTGLELEEYRLLPFGSNYRGGLEVAVGDLNADGFGDLIAGMSTGKGRVGGFLTDATSVDTTPYRSFRGFSGKYNAGVKLTAADFGSYVGSTWTPGAFDGISEIVVGSNAGIRATVKVWDVATTPQTVRTILPFGSKFKGGVTLTTGRYDGDLVPDIFVGAGVFGNSQLEVWSINGGDPAKLAVFADMAKPNAALFTAALDTSGDGIVDNIYGVQGQNGSRGTKGVRDYERGTPGPASQLPLTNNDNFLPPLRIAPLRITLLGGRRPG